MKIFIPGSLSVKMGEFRTRFGLPFSQRGPALRSSGARLVQLSAAWLEMSAWQLLCQNFPARPLEGWAGTETETETEAKTESEATAFAIEQLPQLLTATRVFMVIQVSLISRLNGSRTQKNHYMRENRNERRGVRGDYRLVATRTKKKTATKVSALIARGPGQ